MIRSSMLVATLLAAAVPARADFDVTFAAKGVFTDGTTLGGSVTVDETTGVVAADALTFSGSPGASFSAIRTQGYSSVFADYGFNTDSATSPDELRLGILVSSLVGYGGGSLSSNDTPSPTSYVGDWRNAAGVATPLASGSLSPVPEPGPIALLGSAVAGLAVLARRRPARPA